MQNSRNFGRIEDQDVHLEEHQLIIEGAAMAISNLWKERSKSS